MGDRLIIYGVYSHILKDYLCYYKNEVDAVKMLEERVYQDTSIDYSRNILITSDENKKVIMAIHPIMVQ